ncbi:MAG: amino acid-binding protein [Methanomicrobiaceae archaeon]|nr:amino acid-binding protein [Methanomicrobiaceae archaeon]
MKLEIKDVPGQLLSALKPVSEVGGNIIAVIHQRDPTTTSDVVDVQIMLEVPDQQLDRLIDLIRQQGVNIIRINEERLLVRHSVLLIGHLMHTDLSDTVDRIDSSGYAEVAELTLAMPAIDEPSSAKITLKSANLEEMKKALDILREIAGEKDILMIEPLEDEV